MLLLLPPRVAFARLFARPTSPWALLVSRTFFRALQDQTTSLVKLFCFPLFFYSATLPVWWMATAAPVLRSGAGGKGKEAVTKQAGNRHTYLPGQNGIWWVSLEWLGSATETPVVFFQMQPELMSLSGSGKRLGAKRLAWWEKKARAERRMEKKQRNLLLSGTVSIDKAVNS